MKICFTMLSLFFSLNSFANDVMLDLNNSKSSEIENRSYDFGLRQIRSRSYKTFSIVNTTEKVLTFKSIMMFGSEYRARHSCKEGLIPNEKCLVEVEFYPKFYGYSSGRVELNFSEIEEVIIYVRGLSRQLND